MFARSAKTLASRASSAAFRPAPSSPASLWRLARRTYASEAPTAGPGKLILNFTVPHQPILKDFEATMVNIQSSEGDMGILADHVPTIAQLNAGVVEIFALDNKPRKFFVSGGFAIINPDSSLNINAVEAFPVEELDAEVCASFRVSKHLPDRSFAREMEFKSLRKAARRGVEESSRKENASGATEADKAAARIEREVFEAAVAAAISK
ncbi:F1 complex, delta/epsilon subunit of ATPase [Zopfochytrium polystomum]|nr:F1 complex, delta/epsilon subunit of ATPase [Zopfochytrium polystomum]